MSEQLTGGCQCGRVRYRVTIHNDEAYLCHCRMCQRATGGVSAAFKGVKQSEVEWLGPRPDEYASSPIARRGFCSSCGTPLTFRYPDSEDMDLTVGSFDTPARFHPTRHFGIESRHDAWLDTRALPGVRMEQNPATVERWMKAVGKMPD